MNDFIDAVQDLLDPGFPDTMWRRAFLLRPRKSINGKILWGRSWKRDKLTPLPKDYPDKLMTHRVTQEYASNKEYFLEQLSEGS